MTNHLDITLAGAATLAAWDASIATTVFDSAAFGEITLAYTAALSMLWLAQRRQRRMLIETIADAKSDRDECRKELTDLKTWIAQHLEKR